MAGPTFGIRSNPVVNFDVVNFVAMIAQRQKENLLAAQRNENERKRIESDRQQQEANNRMKEENLKLQQERLEFEKEREQRFKEDTESKIKTREERSKRAQEGLELRQIQTRISAFRALDVNQRAGAKGAVASINKSMASSVPLVQGPEDSHLLRFEGMTPQQLAEQVKRARIAFETKAGDPLIAEDNPALIESLRVDMESAQEALNRRVQQFNIFSEATGHQVAPDQGVRANIGNALMSEIGQILGVTQEPSTPTGEGAVDQATEKPTLRPGTQSFPPGTILPSNPPRVPTPDGKSRVIHIDPHALPPGWSLGPEVKGGTKLPPGMMTLSDPPIVSGPDGKNHRVIIDPSVDIAQPLGENAIGSDLPSRFKLAHESNDRATIQELRREFGTLDEETAFSRFEELQGLIGEAQAESLLFGSK